MFAGSNNVTGTCNRCRGTPASRRMGRGLLAFAALLALLEATACSGNFSLQAPSAEPMTVSDIRTHSVRNFSPGDAPYVRIAGWVAANRTGWSQYWGAPPSSGTMISYDGVSLQFVDNQVLTRTPAGIYQKATSVHVADLLR